MSIGKTRCKACAGTGIIYWKTCPICWGEGTNPHEDRRDDE